MMDIDRKDSNDFLKRKSSLTNKYEQSRETIETKREVIDISLFVKVCFIHLLSLVMS